MNQRIQEVLPSPHGTIHEETTSDEAREFVRAITNPGGGSGETIRQQIERVSKNLTTANNSPEHAQNLNDALGIVGEKETTNFVRSITQ